MGMMLHRRRIEIPEEKPVEVIPEEKQVEKPVKKTAAKKTATKKK